MTGCSRHTRHIHFKLYSSALKPTYLLVAKIFLANNIPFTIFLLSFNTFPIKSVTNFFLSEAFLL